MAFFGNSVENGGHLRAFLPTLSAFILLTAMNSDPGLNASPLLKGVIFKSTWYQERVKITVTQD